jgi:hypothetical protein
MGVFFGRDGEPLPPRSWMELFEDPDYRIVKNEYVTPTLQISTIWQGIDMSHSLGFKPPEIFETIVFSYGGEDSGRREIHCCHYPTESDAMAGHEKLAEGWRVLIEQIKDTAR